MTGIYSSRSGASISADEKVHELFSEVERLHSEIDNMSVDAELRRAEIAAARSSRDAWRACAEEMARAYLANHTVALSNALSEFDRLKKEAT